MKSNKLLILPVVLTTITLLSGIILSSTFIHADDNTDVVDELDVTVNSACTMKGGPNGTDDSGSSTYTTTVTAGNYAELPGSKLVTLCNDPAGYAIYAIGYSGDSYDSQTHTDLIGTETTGNIQTGTTGTNSYWAMKLEAVEGLTPPSIVTDFQNYHVIPGTYTKVASYTTPTATASDAGATVQTKYKINISRTQLAGAYNGKVKYTMVHPNEAPAPTPPGVAVTCDSTKLCVEYDGNGLNFDGNPINRVNYNSTTTQGTVTKYAHTTNINDNGIQDGYYTEMPFDPFNPSAAPTMNVVSIPDAESLTIDLVYGLRGEVYILKGRYDTLPQEPPEEMYNYDTQGQASLTVEGDTVTIFAFIGAVANEEYNYGYYATVSGTGAINERSVASGEFSTPAGSNTIFHGWSNTQTTPGSGRSSDVEYFNESDIMGKLPGNEGETKTVYAVYQQEQAITFNIDNNVSSIAILDSSNNTVATITTSGQSLNLTQGDTYTLKPTYASGYTVDSIAIVSGVGILNGKKFTVGAGSTILSITGKAMLPIQNYECSSLRNVGDTEEVYDTRDNEVYLVGKLEDYNCWLLDNLRLDLTNSAVINNLNSTNTNASDNVLEYLKNGGGTTSDEYAIEGLSGSNWDSGSSYSAPMVNISGYGYTKDTVAPVTLGVGSGKIGVFYNYCAASAGSYCWGNGESSSGSPTSDPKPDSYYDIDADICPSGWSMPTDTTNGDYSELSRVANVNFQTSLSAPLSGNINGGNIISLGNYGALWASTRYSTQSMYSVVFDSNTRYAPSDFTLNRNNGGSVRCIQYGPKQFSVTVSFDAHVDSVTFADGTGTKTATPSNPVVELEVNKEYTIAAILETGYKFLSWSADGNGILGSTTDNPTTYTVTNTSNITVSSQVIPVYNVTVNMDEGVSGISFYSSEYGVQNVTTSGDEATLRSGVEYIISPSYGTGYFINSWSTTENGVLGSTTDSSTTYIVYGNATLSLISQMPSPPVSCVSPVPNLVYMQDLNSSNKSTVLANMVEDSQYYLRDYRDKKTYCVAKLKDGNIWMTQNLDFDIDSNVTYTPADTDISVDWTPDSATNPPDAAEQIGTATVPESRDVGELYWSGVLEDSVPVSTGSSHYHLGNYYNWTAAVAMNSSSSYHDPSQETNQSICPANWTLPRDYNNTGSGSFYNLISRYGWDSSSLNMTNPYIWDSPVKLVLSGSRNESLGGVGKSGSFWSSVEYSSQQALISSISYNGSVSTTYSLARSNLFSVRCLAR